jgi:hypothetical protein
MDSFSRPTIAFIIAVSTALCLGGGAVYLVGKRDHKVAKHAAGTGAGSSPTGTRPAPTGSYIAPTGPGGLTPRPSLASGTGFRYGDGRHFVGTTIQPGTYRSIVPDTPAGCSWSRIDKAGTVVERGRGTVGQAVTVTITANDLIFDTTGCGLWVS